MEAPAPEKCGLTEGLLPFPLARRKINLAQREHREIISQKVVPMHAESRALRRELAERPESNEIMKLLTVRSP